MVWIADRDTTSNTDRPHCRAVWDGTDVGPIAISISQRIKPLFRNGCPRVNRRAAVAQGYVIGGCRVGFEACQLRIHKQVVRHPVGWLFVFPEGGPESSLGKKLPFKLCSVNKPPMQIPVDKDVVGPGCEAQSGHLGKLHEDVIEDPPLGVAGGPAHPSRTRNSLSTRCLPARTVLW